MWRCGGGRGGPAGLTGCASRWLCASRSCSGPRPGVVRRWAWRSAPPCRCRRPIWPGRSPAGRGACCSPRRPSAAPSCGGGGGSSPGCATASPCSRSRHWRDGYGGDRARSEDRESPGDRRAPGGRVRQGGEPLQVGGPGAQGRPRSEREKHHGRDDARGRMRLLAVHQDRRRGCRCSDGGLARVGGRWLSRDASHGGAARRRGQPPGRGRMSERLLKGIGVSAGIAVGPAVVVRWTLPEVPHRVVPRSQVEKEVRRLRAAVKDVKRHIAELKAKAEDRAGVDEARIFDAHLLMLEDKEFLASVAALIRENHLTAEKAFEFKVLEVRDAWAATGSPRLKDRLADLSGVAIRVIEHLMHRGSDELWEAITQPSVVVARELGPGLTVQLDREHVVGLVSEEGTRTSHAAILAHSIGIPAVFGVAGAMQRIEPGTTVVMDGTRGTVLLNPTAPEIAEAKARERRRRVGEAFAGEPVVIRTYDLGGDKLPGPFRVQAEGNPQLGWRAIRVCLDRPEIFRTQIRAALRAAAHADIQLMIPLVTRLDEIDRTREMVSEEATNLKREGVEAAATVPVGVMVETPAAAVMADRLAAVSDFLSVGTNDLTQYTLVVDRGNARLADRFNAHDPSVVRLLKMVVDAARPAGTPARRSGRAAAEPLPAFLLLGLGYDTLSVAPPKLTIVKWMVRQGSVGRARVAAG